MVDNDNSEITRNRILAVSDLALAHKTLVYKIEFLLDPKIRLSRSSKKGTAESPTSSEKDTANPPTPTKKGTDKSPTSSEKDTANPPTPTKNDTDDFPTYSEWHVADITTCFQNNYFVNEYIKKIATDLNEIATDLNVQYHTDMLCSPNGLDMDYVFAYTALRLIPGDKEKKEIFGEKMTTKLYGEKMTTKDCKGSDIIFQTSVYSTTHDAWACVFAAMMKQKLIYNEIADNAETDQVDTIEDEVQKVMEDCHHILKKISILGNPPDPKHEDTEEKSAILRCPEGVFVPESNDNTMNLQRSVKNHVTGWFRDFVLKRTFGRRICSINHPCEEDHQQIHSNQAIGIQCFEDAWFNAGLVDNGYFNDVLFIDSCWLGLRKIHNNTGSHTKLPDFSKISSQNPKITTGIIWNKRSKPELKTKELNEFIQEIYDAQNSKPRVDFLGPSVNGSWDINIKEHFGRFPHWDHLAHCERHITIREFIQKKNYLHSAEIYQKIKTPPTVHSNTQYSRMVSSTREDPRNTCTLTARIETLQPILLLQCNLLQDMTTKFRAYKSRFADTHTKTVVATTKEVEVMMCIHQYMGCIFDETSTSPVSIPPQPLSVLNFLTESPPQYNSALGVLTSMLCENFEERLETSDTYTSSIEWWNSLRDIFSFFMSLLVLSLHHRTDIPLDSTNVPDWLMQTRTINDARGIFAGNEGEWDNFSRFSALTAMEQRTYVYRQRCLRQFECIFEPEGIVTKHNSYTIGGLIACMSRNMETEHGRKKLAKNMNSTFRWQYVGNNVCHDKRFMDHIMCVIIILTGVDPHFCNITHNSVIPPLVSGDTVAT